MRQLLCIALYWCVVSAQDNVPACPVELPPCPEDPPLSIQRPPMIQCAFDTVFRYMDGLLQPGSNSVIQLHRRNILQMKERLQCLHITDDVEPFLNTGFQLATNLWQNIVANAVEIINEFNKVFYDQVCKIKGNIQLVLDDPVAKTILHGFEPVTDMAKIRYLTNAWTRKKMYLDTYLKYASNVRQLHQRALASSCPQQLQQEFVEKSRRLSSQLDELLQLYIDEEQQIIVEYRSAIRCSAAKLRDLQVAAVTLLLT